MKRSEMILEIGRQFPTLHMECDIDELLQFFESQGMLPPAYEKLVEAKGITLCQPSPDIKLFYKLPCNEWEPEDDQH